VPSGNPQRIKGAFIASRWFTRGWTLQELLAPRKLIFYAAGWHEIDTKQGLAREISQTTGIHPEVLANLNYHDLCSVVARLYLDPSTKIIREKGAMESCLLRGLVSCKILITYCVLT
jgi:hypothetical protein